MGLISSHEEDQKTLLGSCVWACTWPCVCVCLCADRRSCSCTSCSRSVSLHSGKISDWTPPFQMSSAQVTQCLKRHYALIQRLVVVMVMVQWDESSRFQVLLLLWLEEGLGRRGGRRRWCHHRGFVTSLCWMFVFLMCCYHLHVAFCYGYIYVKILNKLEKTNNIYIYETKMGSKCHTVYVDIVRNVYCFTKSLTGVCVNLFFKYAYCFLGSLLMGF